MGRGKGFAVVERSSGLDNPELCLAMKPKLLSLLAVMAAHRYIVAEELTTAIAAKGGAAGEAPLAAEIESLRQQNESLVSALEMEAMAKDLVEERLRMETECLGRERERTQEALARIAKLSHDLQEHERIWTVHLAASRGSLLALRHIREELKLPGPSNATLASPAGKTQETLPNPNERRATPRPEPRTE